MKTMILMTSSAVLLVALAGCGGGHSSRETGATGAASSTATAESLSGPPTFGEGFKARDPRKCTSVKDVPSPNQAAALIQCGMESGDAYSVSLWQNVGVELGQSRPYQYTSDSHYSSIDTTSPVYPIRVTADHLTCMRDDATCLGHHSAKATGDCYKTTFGDWNCFFSTTDQVDPAESRPAPPTTY